MNYRQFCAYQERKYRRNQIKNWTIVALVLTVALLLGVVLSLKRAYSLREYAIANNCTWTWMGTATGTDQDYICK